MQNSQIINKVFLKQIKKKPIVEEKNFFEMRTTFANPKLIK